MELINLIFLFLSGVGITIGSILFFYLIFKYFVIPRIKNEN